VATFDGIGTLKVIDLSVVPAAAAGSITVPTIPATESTAITPDGRYAVVSDGSAETDVVTVDLQTRTVVSTVSGLPGNQAVAITPDGSQVLVLAAGANLVSVLSISPVGVLADTGQRVGLAGGVNGGRVIAIAPGGDVALVTSTFGVVSVLKANGGLWAFSSVVGNLGAGVSGLAMTPDGSKAYVSRGGLNEVAVLSVNGSNVTDTTIRIAVPAGTPETFFGVPGLAVTPDGMRLFIASFASDVISIVDTTTDTLLPFVIPVGDGPAGIGMPPR
jgi:YVTN family beta-propeller protein